jgi:hypothetical protein
VGTTARLFDDFREVAGSPPQQAWGRLHLSDVDLSQVRFTPTDVGTTITSSLDHEFPTVHPHVREGNDDRLGITSRSSVYPHLRGDK